MKDCRTLKYYLDASAINLKRMSRTANGIVDTSASDTKKAALLEVGGAEAAATAKRNFEEALACCYDQRKRRFDTREEVRSFVEQTAERINAGIVRQGQLIRSGQDSVKYAYTRLDVLAEECDWFYGRLLELLQDPETDSRYLAAFLEYYVNMRIHMFSDGCGKAAMVLAVFACMRADAPLMLYEGREAYYRYDVTSVARCGSEEDRADFARFYEYYRSLPAASGQ